MCTGVMKFHRTMPPRSITNSDVSALSQSALNVAIVPGAHREMRCCGITPPNTKMLRATLRGLLRRFVQVHGQQRLMPKRAAPMLRPIALSVLQDACTSSGSLQHMPW